MTNHTALPHLSSYI